MSKPIGSINSNPLFFFEDLIQNGGIRKCYESFLLDKEMHSGTFLSNDNIEFTFSIQEGDSSDYKLITEKFQDKLIAQLEGAYSNCILGISDQLVSYKTNDERKDFIIHVRDVLDYLINYIDKINAYSQSDLIKIWILKLLTYIGEKYKSIRIDNLLQHDSSENRSAGYFRYKYKQSSLSKLFQILKDLKFLGEESEEEIKLKEIILSDKPESLLKPVKTNCEVQKAAYIFFKMQDLFYNFSLTNIEASKSFLTKQNKLFNANTLSASKTKFLKNLRKDEDKSEIDDAFEIFIKSLKS